MAVEADVPFLSALIPLSVRALSQTYYSAEQIESAIRYVFGVDSQLIRDGTYFVAEADAGMVGCGGWSRRATLFGGDQMNGAEDPLLDPSSEPARIRAFFVHPDYARRGIGSLIVRACIEAAQDAGFHSLALVATLPGEPLYRTFGFLSQENFEATLPDGVRLPLVQMIRGIDPSRTVSALVGES